jgi:Zn finger protein HypA/HybF involved in hydrogenase expression
MPVCSHRTLELLPERSETLRCRHCHLTIDGDELAGSYCPECFDRSGDKRYEFDTIDRTDNEVARYLCEECGAIVTSR